MKTFFYCLLFSGVLFKAQEKLPYDRNLLYHFSIEGTNDSILPTYKNGAFEYINLNTGKTLFNKRFKEAYPFVGKAALVFNEGQQSYDIIDRNGNVLFSKKNVIQIKPLYGCRVPGFIMMLNDIATTYNLYQGMEGDQCSRMDHVDYENFRPPLKRTAKNTYIFRYKNNKTIEFDSIRPLSDHSFLALRNKKLGILDFDGKVLVPLQFEKSSIEFIGDNTRTVQLIPLKKEGIWYYYDYDGNLWLKGDQPLTRFPSAQRRPTDALGFYPKGEKFNILYINGKSLGKDYGWVSGNGSLVGNGNDIYFVRPDATVIPYYVKE